MTEIADRANRAERTEGSGGLEGPSIADAPANFALSQTFAFRLENVRANRKDRRAGQAIPAKTAPPAPLRVARLLVLAHSIERAVREGTTCRDYADAARSMKISRARLSQLANLILLAPEIQEEILFMEAAGKSAGSFQAVNERALRWVARTAVWEEQRKRWGEVAGGLPNAAPSKGD